MRQVSKLLSWDVGKIDASKLPNLRGSVNLITGATPEPTNPSIRWIIDCQSQLVNYFSIFSVQFAISQLAVSGLKVNRLDMYGEKYKPFKGVKYLTKAGRFQVRMWWLHLTPCLEVLVDQNCDYYIWIYVMPSFYTPQGKCIYCPHILCVQIWSIYKFNKVA